MLNAEIAQRNVTNKRLHEIEPLDVAFDGSLRADVPGIHLGKPTRSPKPPELVEGDRGRLGLRRSLRLWRSLISVLADHLLRRSTREPRPQLGSS
jgi:hypothetical protein